jgi:protein-S-isoprenylcysteine O-methyltransferase Ste14
MNATRLAWLVLGTAIGGYWLRVWRMARTARRRSGRAANFIPAEPLGRRLRVVWIPVVCVWIANPFCAGLSARPIWLLAPLRTLPMIAWLGCALAVCSFCGTIFCWKTMGRSWRMGIDPAERTELISRGPYAWLAHPIYALSQTMMLGTLLSLSSPLLLVAGMLHIALLHWEAHREEEHMLRSHGEAYRQYRARVGGFVPKSFRTSSPA